MNCPDCGKKLEYSGLVEGESDWVYRSYKCPNCGRDALGSAVAKLLNKAVGWYGGRAGVVPGKAEGNMNEEDLKEPSTLLEYLANWGRRLYPRWHWEARPPAHLLKNWERDVWMLKATQWRGWGKVPDGFEKWGIILVLPAEAMLQLTHFSLDELGPFATRNVQEMIGHATYVPEGGRYPELIPTIECE